MPPCCALSTVGGGWTATAGSVAGICIGIGGMLEVRGIGMLDIGMEHGMATAIGMEETLGCMERTVGGFFMGIVGGGMLKYAGMLPPARIRCCGIIGGGALGGGALPYGGV